MRIMPEPKAAHSRFDTPSPCPVRPSLRWERVCCQAEPLMSAAGGGRDGRADVHLGERTAPKRQVLPELRGQSAQSWWRHRTINTELVIVTRIRASIRSRADSDAMFGEWP